MNRFEIILQKETRLSLNTLLQLILLVFSFIIKILCCFLFLPQFSLVVILRSKLIKDNNEGKVLAESFAAGKAGKSNQLPKQWTPMTFQEPNSNL